MQSFSGSSSAGRLAVLPILFALFLIVSTPADCGEGVDRVFASTFTEVIQPLFPNSGGTIDWPDYELSDRLQWVIDELAASETTSLAEIQARFSGGFDQPGLVSFFNDVLRPQFPNAVVIDVVGVSPTRATVVIDGDNPASELGYLNLWTQYAGSGLITYFSVGNFSGSVQFPGDQDLTLGEAADHFQGLTPANSLYIGRVDSQGQCSPVLQREGQTPRALGSIFKMWVLAAVAQRLADGLSNPQDPITLVASERAAGGIINDEPLGTSFSVDHMATLMMGNSDNTSTDHLHELVGRTAIAGKLADIGVEDPQLLLPFLNISEQFHVFTRFDLPTAQSYVNGSQAFREQFLSDEIVPEGPSYPIDFPFFHDALLTEGTWRATAEDICRTLASLQGLPRNSPAFEVVDRAMGSQAAQPGVRNEWARVWYKGGSLESGVSGLHVLTHAWLLQADGASRPWVVVALSNNDAGNIDAIAIQSVTSRILELVAGMPD